MSRADPEQHIDTGMASFKKVVNETKDGQETNLLHRLTKDLIVGCEKGVVSDPVMSSILTLSSLVGIPSVKLSTVKPAENWGPCYAVLTCVHGLPTKILTCHEKLTSILGRDIKGQSFVALVDTLSVPFLLACCIRVNITGLPHECSTPINIKNEPNSRNMMVRFGGNSDFQVFFSPLKKMSAEASAKSWSPQPV